MNHLSRNRDSFIDQLNPFINRIFQHAVMQGDMAVVSLMLKHGVVVRRNERNRFGLTALQQSVLDGNYRLVVRLLESGADLEAKTSNGWTSLHIASAAGDINMVYLLLSNCADVVALTKNEELPIDVATSKDIKIALANHMSRCGYIELSQWYMGHITPLDSGVVYVMSADSLLHIACDSPESYPTDGYGFYSSNVMNSYSSMVNLQTASASEPCIAIQSKPRVRKGSVWSLSHQYAANTQDTPMQRSDNDSHARPEAAWIDSRKKAHRSLSSGCLIERTEPHLERVEEQTTMPTYFETGLADQDPENIQDSFYRQSVYVTNVTETGTMRRIKRKMSTRRKISESGMQIQDDWEDEAVAPVYVSIDYYQESINLQDGYEDNYENEYFEYESDKRDRQGSTCSSSSVDYGETLQALSDGSIERDKTENVTNTVSRDQTLLNEFAENRAALARYETGDMTSSGHFEIDTDNMDDMIPDQVDIENELLHSDSMSEEESNSEDDMEDGDSQEKNMYFNPMYRSVDVLDKERQQTNTKGAIPQSGYQQKPAENNQGKVRRFSSGKTMHNQSNGNAVESKDRKRKKRGLISGLVSKFKGTVKIHRTSSDTDLHSPDENAIQRRDNRKVKTLRRRRHVRRSNSFSSYFPPVLEQGDTKEEKTKDGNRDLQVISSPYSRHGKDRSPLKSSNISADHRATKQYSSLPRGSSLSRGDKDYHLLASKENYERGKCQSKLNGDVDLGINGNANYIDISENVVSKIPVKSVNTYTKGLNGTKWT